MKKTVKLLSATVLAGLLLFNTNAEASAQSFKDVATNHWAYSTIEQVANRGYIAGYPNGTFAPSNEVTRAEFAAFLSRIIPGESTKQHTFSDVPSNHWSTHAINKGLALGFINPNDFNNGRFEPNRTLTRAEMAKWMANGLAQIDEDYGQALKDTKDTLVPIPEYYGGQLKKPDVPYVAVSLGTGLLNGYQDDTFRPQGKTTRAEVAALLVRYLNVMQADAESFQGLEELRAVGTTGTNVEVTTNYEITEPFSNIRNKEIPHLRGIGSASVNRLIFLDGVGQKHNSIYSKMFVGERGAGSDQHIPVFVEKSFKASNSPNYNAYYNDYIQGLIYGSRLDVKNLNRFNLPGFDGYNFSNYMNSIAGTGKTYWEMTTVNRAPLGDSTFHHRSIFLNPNATVNGERFTITVRK
ncbi:MULTISPECIES: S-layer homology domain-containing protein [Alkalihalophilus]|uniref:S-layer like protein n=1 Tax=Alkalihalophilus pseudofirmus (strain ATCC BAA-2126 / JCM 17055 / OF4) TaxID=398511 RepID=D3G1J9_ALKPO|nr:MULTISPECIES: S-layer homology domain-containing protein [Alkalihalophilus]ADC52225.1 S-layer like protein [Alkalihalophilus pseudofirmus OF4]MEC2074365.1 S-layer homology domain-containing protein [Alkalihalophilus marmarensis]